ncbi:hypothetical protein [Nocardioides sp.]|uniref:hypothetical protein n=1 Tax=Nocardioides sp. TaxID=35761 RepID=UPI00271A12E8|nr:hypothetical protein [Nocardioides sp.]MDO9456074.1 hypothetical protein [Nocardioides sp.]
MRRAAGAAALLLLVAACSSGDPGAPPAPSSSGESTAAAAAATEPGAVTTPEPTEAAPPPPSVTRDPLADLVEDIEVDEGPVLGADISWPQCPPGMGIPEKRSSGQPLPVEAARYVVVGLTNGPGFYPNPCLASQVDYVRQRGLMISAYAVASYPEADLVAQHGQDGPYDGSTAVGALANTGYQQALFNVRSMETAGLETPVVWIDVEPVPSFAWSSDLSANAAVVAGVARGYQDEGYRIGVYSTPALWRGVVGDLELGVPEWRAAGQTSAEEALSRCGDDWVIQGGDAVLGQWVEADRDMNLTCPGISADLAPWFHQY